MAEICPSPARRFGRRADDRTMAKEARLRSTRFLPVAAGALSASAYVGLTSALPLGVADYRIDAGPSVAALGAGHLERFLALRPAMGPVSVLARAPVAALSGPLGLSEMQIYRLGAVVCLLAVALLGAWLVSQMAARGATRLARAGVLAVLAFSPTLRQTLLWGHPEELLAGALCVAALLAARREHPWWAAVLLGGAVATKQWALLAALPVLAVAGPVRIRLILLAATIALAAYAPWLATNVRTVAQSNAALLSAHSWISPPEVWWPLAEVRSHLAFDGVATHAVARHLLPGPLNPVAHPLAALLGLACGLLLLGFRGRRVGPEQALAVLALAFLLRCALDPWNNAYYAAPLLLVMLARDACLARFPVVSVAAAVGLWLTLVRLPALVSADSWCAAYLLFAAALGTHLTLSAFAPGRLARLARALQRPLGPAANPQHAQVSGA